MKTCTKCNRELPLSAFYTRANGNGLRAACKACHAEAAARRREAGGAALRAKRAKAKRERLAGDQEARMRATLASFGLTPDEFRQMEETQNGVCAICEQPETDKRNHRLAVDHDHDTGRIRGLLCKSCNIGLGMFRDSTNNLRRAINYLRRTAS